MDTVISSVEKTERLLIVHEAVKSTGIGAEIAARVAEKAVASLAASIKRVAGYNTPYPVGTIEDDWLPNDQRVVKALNELLAYE